MHPDRSTESEGRRLDSWKEIAAYLGRDVRTVQRWETRDGLPVHRLHHAKLGSVFAYSIELDAWCDARDQRVTGLEAEARPLAAPPESDPTPAGERHAWRAGLVATAVATVLVSGGAIAWWGASQGRVEPPRYAAVQTVNPDAWERYLRARFLMNKPNATGLDRSESVRLFEESIARDGGYAPAYAGLASAYQQLGTTGAGVSPVVNTIPKSVAAARRALELDSRLGEALTTLAEAEHKAWHWAEAERAYRSAVQVNPDDTGARLGLGGLLVHQGRAAEGIALVRAARDADPLSIPSTVRLGWLLYHARRYDEAARELRIVVEAQPSHRDALWFLGFALIELGEFDEAIAVLERAARLSDRGASELGVLARAYGLAGRLDDAWQVIAELEERARLRYVPPAAFVNAYMGVGDHDAAFTALDRAYREHSNVVLFLKSHPLYDPIRTDRRFTALLHNVGLAD